ncbi:hypothetical protein [Microlunatus sp. Y2014]|uniref:hypothetical protein n=1 Tax=Microlunatus sp. Y2014 TaxID=3418488 RepID=UPI003DA78E29
MHFVRVEKNDNSAPTEAQLTEAMNDCGGTVVSVEGNNSARTVHFTGDVNHTEYENKLQEIVPNARRTSWNFVWADGLGTAVAKAAQQDVLDFVQTAQLLSVAAAASEKSVRIEVAADDLEKLKQAKYRLCFAKKVGDSAYNVVWQAYDKYLASNTFSWTPQYELFGSNTFEENVQVFVSTNKVRIGLGETAELNPSGNLGPAYTGGPATAFTMVNDYGSIHPGVNQISTSSMGTTQSTPIYVAENAIVEGSTVLTPVEKVLVWFQQDIQTSTMFSSARSKSIEVDLTQKNSAVQLYSNGAWSTPA